LRWRSEVFVTRFLSLVFALGLSSFALASSVQVVYVAQGTSIVTYNVDPRTLNFTQVGTVSIKGASTFGTVVPSPNDHFIYVMAADATQTTHLYVYATDANGAPQSQPMQTLYAKPLKSLQIDPTGNFLYAIYTSPISSTESVSTIRRFVVSPTNGAISQSLTQAKYTLHTQDVINCTLTITGFNSTATELYDQVYCGTHEGPYANYYERTFNATGGALGPDVQIYAWGSDGQSQEAVQFVGNRMFDFVYPDSPPQIVNIYPAVPNTSKPQVQCTSSMLAACGALNGVVAHPSGQYLFIGNSSSSASEIEKIDYSGKKIFDTGNQVPYIQDISGRFGSPFSPDGRLVFTTTYTGYGYYLQVSGFNVSTAQVTSGATIWVPSSGPNNLENAYFTATRF
jgi:hypothetical protein